MITGGIASVTAAMLPYSDSPAMIKEKKNGMTYEN